MSSTKSALKSLETRDGQTLHAQYQSQRPAIFAEARNPVRLVAALDDGDRLSRGGARRVRTDDLMLAKHALYQLSYGPKLKRSSQNLRDQTIKIGGPRRTRTADLTLIRRVL